MDRLVSGVGDQKANMLINGQGIFTVARERRV